MAEWIKVGQTKNVEVLKVIDYLSTNLPANYKFFSDVTLRVSGGKRAIDVLVLTPHAIYVVEIKQYGGRISGGSKKWTLNTKQSTESPLRHVQAVAKSFSKELAGYYPELARIPIQGCVCLTGSVKPDLKIAIDFNQIKHVRWIHGIEEYLSNPYYISNSSITADFLVVAMSLQYLTAMLGKLPETRKVSSSQTDPWAYFHSVIPLTTSAGKVRSHQIVSIGLKETNQPRSVTIISQAIRRWNPKHIIILGTATGFAKNNIQRGDVIIAKHLVNYEIQTPHSNEATARWSFTPADTNLISLATMIPVVAWRKRLKSSYLNLPKTKVHFGALVSGQRVENIPMLLEQYSLEESKLLGFEIESGGMLSTVFQSTKNPSFITISGVSDINGQAKVKEKWKAYTVDVAASFAMELMASGLWASANDILPESIPTQRFPSPIDNINVSKVQRVLLTNTPTPNKRARDSYLYDAFISYHNDDWEWIDNTLAPKLEVAGLNLFIDRRDMRPGTDWLLEIERAVSRSRSILLVVSPSYISGVWSKLGSILAPSSRSTNLIPIILKNTDLPYRLSHLTAINLVDANDETPWTTLTRSLTAIKQGQALTPTTEPDKAIVGDFVEVGLTFGRDREIKLIRQWILDSQSRIIIVHGVAGIGKSFMVGQLSQTLRPNVSGIFWRNLANLLPVEKLLNELIQFLSGESIDSDLSFEKLLLKFITYRGKKKYVVVLDSVEVILSGDGNYRSGLENYRKFFRSIINSSHNRRIILITREIPVEMADQRGGVHLLALSSLGLIPSTQLLRSLRLDGTDEELRLLATKLSGHPLSLRIAGAAIQEFYDGNIGKFLSDGLASVRVNETLLRESVEKLSVIEKNVLFWIATRQAPVSINDLLEFFQSTPDSTLSDALDRLARKSLIEQISRSSWHTPTLVTKYIQENQVSINLSALSFEIEGNTGIYTNRPGNITLKTINNSDSHLYQIVIELEDTPLYHVYSDTEPVQRLVYLQPWETQWHSFPIEVSKPGKITLQLKVNNTLYRLRPLEIHAVEDNPYFYGPPVSDKYIFFGREMELQLCLNNISRVVGAHTMVIGEQRSGKTSLLYQIRDRLQAPFIPIYISFSGIERDENSALHWLLAQIFSNLKQQGLLADNIHLAPLKFGTDFVPLLNNLVTNVLLSNPDVKIALLLDEGHIIGEIGVRFQEVLREAFSHLIQSVRVVLASYYDFFEFAGNSGSPLHNIFEFTFLRPLEGNGLLNLIVEPASWFGVEYEFNAINAIQSISGGHPYYCQYMCAKCFDEAQYSDTRKVTLEHVARAEQLALQNEKERFVMGYWNRFTSEELLILEALINQRPLIDKSGKSFRRLTNKFVLLKRANGYEFSSRLFRAWVTNLLKERD